MEKLTEHIVNELNNGAFDCPEVRCGFIGEIGCCDPLDGKDINVLIWFIPSERRHYNSFPVFKP